MARRRTRGQGSPYQDKHGQWWAKIPIGGGKTRRARCADRKEAEATLKKMLEDRDDYRIDLSASQQSVKAWLEKWLEAKRLTVKPSTWEFYQRHAAYTIDHIGYLKLEALEAHHIRAMLAVLAKDGLSPQSCEHVRAVLRNTLTMAHKDHLVRENVAKNVDAPSITPFDAPILSDEEMTALFDCVDGRRRLCPKRRVENGEWRTEWEWREGVTPDRLAPLLHLVLALGFRHGEILKLLWADWDKKARTLRVKDAKTPSGWRYLPLSDDLHDMLLRLWDERQEERKLPHWKEHFVIFASEAGTPIGHRNMTRWFDRIQHAAGLTRHIRVHDLRHTAISDWFAAGADPRSAQDLAGHASPVTTQRIYAKTRATRSREIIEATQERRRRKA